ncbi:methylamine dehydrogenase (amicyanin) large subunit [Paracoccus chinensis]|uniref:methylamine dehydrogenase (amicyanin) large subunit n=1 Tax=Paracoccus chinensis TaxID=525640 RepID=UPI001FE04063|nr:methylamine dehydrogenase (amicyanin) large subunit [Paracoccus chinensis]
MRASFVGAGLTCSLLALSAAWAQTPTPAEGQPPAAEAPAATTPAADAAPAATGAAPADASATSAAPAGGQTHGQRAAAEAAAALAAGEDDEPVILDAPAPNSRRVYVNDSAHFASLTQQFAIDTEEGRVIGMTDSGFLPNPVVSDDGSVYAQVSTTYSRISRGEREDYVEVFDPVTFNPVADITIPPEGHRFLVGTYPWMSALTPDNKTLLYYQFSPAPAVGVVDLEGKAFRRMLEVPDCYHIFPTAADNFFMHCRDGSLARVQFDAASDAEPQVTHSEVFHPEDEYVVNHPAYSQKSGRLVWPTYEGKIYQFDLSSGEAKALNTIEGLTEEERADNWRPGGWQLVAYHRPSNRIYMLVDQRAEWTHKTPSRHVVVINADTGERIARHELGHGIDSVAVSQDDDPLLYGLSTGAKTLYIYDAETGEELRSVNQLGHGPTVISLSDMG